MPNRLSFVESLVLALIAEGPTHCFAVSRLLGRQGAVGRTYAVPRPIVYRAVDRLVEAGLVRPLRVEAGDHGPPRTIVTATTSGRQAARRWQQMPVEHVRDVRTELLAKLALLDLSGKDPTPLLEAQQRVLEPIVSALAERCQATEGFDLTVALWRHETALAALRFVERQVKARVTP